VSIVLPSLRLEAAVVGGIAVDVAAGAAGDTDLGDVRTGTETTPE
jgi:hypothetical protein